MRMAMVGMFPICIGGTEPHEPDKHIVPVSTGIVVLVNVPTNDEGDEESNRLSVERQRYFASNT